MHTDIANDLYILIDSDLKIGDLVTLNKEYYSNTVHMKEIDECIDKVMQIVDIVPRRIRDKIKLVYKVTILNKEKYNFDFAFYRNNLTKFKGGI